jgi:hypothetical protein
MAESAYTDDRLTTLVGDMLSAAPAPVSQCFTVEAVREALTRSFDFWAQARAEDPEDGQRPLWDLRMYDGDLENAAFVVWVWERGVVWLACGVGDSYEVQHFCGHRAAYECDGVLAAMQSQFRMPVAPIGLALRAVEHWICRSWEQNEKPPG